MPTNRVGCCCAASGCSSGKLCLAITGCNSAAVEGAYVEVKTSPGGVIVGTCETDEYGECCVTDLPPGSYTYSVEADGYEPVVGEAFEIGSGCNTVNESVALDLDGTLPCLPCCDSVNHLTIAYSDAYGSLTFALGGTGAQYEGSYTWNTSVATLAGGVLCCGTGTARTVAWCTVGCSVFDPVPPGEEIAITIQRRRRTVEIHAGCLCPGGEDRVYAPDGSGIAASLAIEGRTFFISCDELRNGFTRSGNLSASSPVLEADFDLDRSFTITGSL